MLVVTFLLFPGARPVGPQERAAWAEGGRFHSCLLSRQQAPEPCRALEEVLGTKPLPRREKLEADFSAPSLKILAGASAPERIT